MYSNTHQELLEKISKELDQVKLDKENILGKGGIIKELTKIILDKALEAEMDDHLGWIGYSFPDS